eukprot:scaffold5437_cov195-Chaetoceros_neogracile.AAC.1
MMIDLVGPPQNIIRYQAWLGLFFVDDYDKISTKRHQQDLNLRGRTPTDFKSVALTTRPWCHTLIFSLET